MRISDWSSDVCSSDLLLTQEVGMGAMTASLLKQVIIALARRSLKSSQSWTDRFSVLADRQITRAFAEMVARPGAAHTVQSLAYSASLSRSAFMARFSELFGRSPMAILRDLRMQIGSASWRERVCRS